MAFENQILGLDILEAEPIFTVGVLRDVNPLGRTKKTRKIEKPNQAMRFVHQKLAGYLRKLPVEYSYATAFRKGCSPLKSVERHRNSRFFYLLDLRDAYHSVDIARLAKIICEIDPNKSKSDYREIKSFLERYCMSIFGGLPTGAPASPALFNLYCAYLIDSKLGELVARNRWVYTRYSDDLTFSSAESPITRIQRKEIRAIIEGAGFQTNHAKSRVIDLEKGPIFINGIGLELGGRVFISRGYTRHVLELILRGLQGELDLQPKIEGAMGVFRGVTGKLNRINETEGKVLSQYRKFRWACRPAKRKNKKRR